MVLLFNKTISFSEVRADFREGFEGSPAAQLLLYPSDELRFKCFSVQCFCGCSYIPVQSTSETSFSGTVN
jgi:hypothetical protein